MSERRVCVRPELIFLARPPPAPLDLPACTPGDALLNWIKARETGKKCEVPVIGSVLALSGDAFTVPRVLSRSNTIKRFATLLDLLKKGHLRSSNLMGGLMALTVDFQGFCVMKGQTRMKT